MENNINSKTIINDISINFSNLQEGNLKILNDIKNLQNLEDNLYNILANVELTNDQKQQIMNRINELLQMRINLFLNLKNTYNNYEQNLSTTTNVLGQQETAINIIEKELEQSKEKLNLLQQEKINKIRQVAINTYYGKKYNAQTRIMQTIVILCIPILILSILGNKELIPSSLNTFLLGIIIIIGIIIIGKQIVDLSNRNNMNFDEYNWKFNIGKVKTSSESDSNINDPWNNNNTMCLGQECCNNRTIYDNNLNICVPLPTNTCSTTNNI